MSTSYPYLTFSRKHNLDYGEVLNMVTFIEHNFNNMIINNMYYNEFYDIIQSEHERRRKVLEDDKAGSTRID
jgi:hypothetical protein